jgi:hypothetical protein
LTDFAEANVNFFDAAILIFSPPPVHGAWRKGVAFSLVWGTSANSVGLTHNDLLFVVNDEVGVPQM